MCIRPKGRIEHNVYSLVPNIAVCMYIYIDTKFSYDNNVYYSIFCEHRQLKTCGFMWLNGCMWLSGFTWLSGFMWLKVTKSG